jgi:hypothetical protein
MKVEKIQQSRSCSSQVGATKENLAILMLDEQFMVSNMVSFIEQ